MDENVKNVEVAVVEQDVAPTAREELKALLMEILPEEKRSEDVEQMALDYIKEQVEMSNRMAEKIAEDPRLAQVFADVVAGTRKPGAALARYFGKNILAAEEGTPEYEELVKADEEYWNELNAAEKMKEEQGANAAAWFDALEQYCEKNGLDKDVYIPKIEDMVIIPSLDLVISDELFARLVKAVDYDKDVEDAFAAGEVKGRNTNIHEMRARVGDGMPKGLSSQGAPVEKPKKPMNSLLAKALNA